MTGLDLRSVRATVTDAEVLRTITPDAAVSYMRRSGWSYLGTKQGLDCPVSSWVLGGCEVDLPLDPSVRDYPLRMAEVLTTLAAVEDRSQLAILAELVDAEASYELDRLQHELAEARDQWLCAKSRVDFLEGRDQVIDAITAALVEQARADPDFEARYMAAISRGIGKALAAAEAARPGRESEA
jgi:hypothetical protein